MNKKKSLLLASVIFGAVAVLHLLRAVLGWQVSINNFNIPVYFSYIVFVAAGFLSFVMYNAAK